MPTVQQVVNILGEFYEYEMNNEAWQEMFDANKLGWDIAWMAFADLVTPEQPAAIFMQRAWDDFCKRIDIDPYNEFETLGELTQFVEDVG